MNQIELNKTELEHIYNVIGMNNPKGLAYKEKEKKHEQILAFLMHLEKAINKLSTKRQLVLVDCACGKSYLSFIANYYLTKVKKCNVRFIGIDYNEHVIKESKIAAKQLGYDNMDFICSDIFKVSFNESPDIVYSLHACDTATDMTIAKGVIEKAKHIMAVSCCQHTIRNKIKKHSLNAITRHGIYKERFSDMLADSMRSLVLESHGYKVTLFDYIAASETPKNIMVRASKIGTINEKKKLDAEIAYNNLVNIFNAEPMLNDYIHDN